MAGMIVLELSVMLILELLAILIFIGLYLLMKKLKYKRAEIKLIVLFVGILLFEILLEPIWLNSGLDSWAYLYGRLSWVIALGWTDIFIFSFLLVDRLFVNFSESKKFWINLMYIMVISVPIEIILLSTGIRSYSPALLSTFSGITIPFTSAPIEILIAVPMIIAMVLSFYKMLSNAD